MSPCAPSRRSPRSIAPLVAAAALIALAAGCADAPPAAQESPDGPGGAAPAVLAGGAPTVDAPVPDDVVRRVVVEADAFAGGALRLAARRPFRAVGLRWDGDAGLEARARLADGTWTAWRPALVTWREGIAHNGTWLAPRAAVAVELRGRAAPPAFAAVELLATAPLPAVAPRGGFRRVEAALAPTSLVLPRSAWGARETSCAWAFPQHTPRYATVHHTVSPNDDAMSVEARLRQIQAYHIDNRGWCDIGYHFLVSRDGRLWQGLADETRWGAHVYGHNQDNVGVSFIGSFHLAAPPEAMLDAGVRILAWLIDTYGIAADRSHVLGHQEWGSSTACPGSYLLGHVDHMLASATDGDPGDPGDGGGPPCQADDRFYCGRLLGLEGGLYRCVHGRYAEVDVEADYLPHVVQCENGGAGPAALRAQAVAARSYLYYKLETSGQVVDSQADQVYSCGATPWSDHVEAVAATAGTTLAYGGATTAAFYVAGAQPSAGSCVAAAGDPDPTRTERFVTYNWDRSGAAIEQTSLGWADPANLRNRGCLSQWGSRCLANAGWGHEDILRFYYGMDIDLSTAAALCEPAEGGGAPDPEGVCPSGDGIYCGESAPGLTDGNLYRCDRGNWLLIERCPYGCAPQPPGSPDRCQAGTGEFCPDGDGLYCGGPVGRDPQTLFRCAAGVYTPVQVCDGECKAAPPGQADYCKNGSTACPFGDGLYCGAHVGLARDTLYDCAAGEWTIVERCDAGCFIAPPGEPDRCAGAPAGGCPHGEGLYCGGAVGLDADTLYRCEGGAFTIVERCDHGCAIAAPGVADACRGAPACPYGDGFYCGATLGYDEATLYLCTAGNYRAVEVCADGCHVAPPGQPDYCGAAPAATCPDGDGLYCGATPGVPGGLDADTLYRCAGGVWSPVETCPDGCVTNPPGTADACGTGSPACPSGNGAYCGATLGLDPDTLYGCVNGVTTPLEACPRGCELMPPGTADRCYGAAPPPCPAGNGLYCGGTLGLADDTLYQCTDGVVNAVETCANGCETMPAGTADRCAGGGATCPSGDGLYCGATLGLDADTLYRCTAGASAPVALCDEGCRTMPAGTPDECATPSVGCPSGNGAYCGGTLGLDGDTLYSCANGQTTVIQVCANGCETMPAGTADRCAGSSGAGLGICNPFDPPRSPTCGFGCYSGHRGTDYAVAEGTPVRAPVGGVVTDLEDGVAGQTCYESFGNYVKIEQGHYTVILGHLSQAIEVDRGDPVSAGDLVGYVSNTGYTLTETSAGWQCQAGGGYHLHLEVRRDGAAFDPYAADDVSWGDCGGGPSPVCPSGNGAYCGGTLGLDADTLYECTDGVTTPLEVCPAGCHVAPPGSPDYCETGGAACPSGNGLYCGGSVGLDGDTLYQCTNGSYSAVEVCAHGCHVAPPGAPDYCEQGGAACPSGDGLYCGSGVGLDAATLYRCAGGSYTAVEVCAHGCHVAPPGAPDYCEEGAACPSGDGLYCGSGVGLDDDTLYRCASGRFTAVEVCAHGCQAAPPGTPDGCAAGPACPSGDGLYCGGGPGVPAGLDGDTLYQCAGGAWTPHDYCPWGCHVAAPGTSDYCDDEPTCPSGDGLYCGGPVGLDGDRLYRCTAGVFTAVETCSNGCHVAAPGTSDYCEAPPSCPSGNGRYCGGSVGRDEDTLYDCRDGSYSVREVCAHGCHVAPPGTSDYCESAPGSCPSGNGLYCGSTVGRDDDTLYYCRGGDFSVRERCDHGCHVASPGVSDYCEDPPASCPSGNGLYCGSTVGRDSDKLYYCRNGDYSVEERCDHGCHVSSPGVSDYCNDPPASCPSGNGLYCGGPIGRNEDKLYYCRNGDYSTEERCEFGCHVSPPGVADYCERGPGSCPYGNGLYCGGPVGLDDDTLYYCSNGSWSEREDCDHGCYEAPPGYPDRCN